MSIKVTHMLFSGQKVKKLTDTVLTYVRECQEMSEYRGLFDTQHHTNMKCQINEKKQLI